MGAAVLGADDRGAAAAGAMDARDPSSVKASAMSNASRIRPLVIRKSPQPECGKVSHPTCDRRDRSLVALHEPRSRDARVGRAGERARAAAYVVHGLRSTPGSCVGTGV